MSAERRAGEAALAALDRALAKQPARDGEAFTEATGQLCTLRDSLIAHRRAGREVQAQLDSVNALISSALAGHFPIGKAPWPEIERARDALRDLLGAM